MRAAVEPLADALAAARNGRPATNQRRALDAAAFIFDEPEHVPAIWGNREKVLWAAGEPLMIVGPQGVGKTTLGQQLALKRHGIGNSQLLGHPIAEDRRPVLYIAADRPRQAARSFRRMVGEADRPALEWLAIWRGPLPFDLAGDPGRLAEFVGGFDAGTVVIDSLKDVALDLSRDETGSRVNVALQELVATGVEVLVLHHQRKASADNRQPRALADVYGSTWLTGGIGSVLLLWGDPGDPVIDLRHLKQPAEEVGPLKLIHDHEAGTSTIYEARDVLDVVAGTPGGVTAPDAARAVYESAEPAQVEKARRKLERLVAKGVADRIAAQAPEPVRYRMRSVGTHG